MTETRILILAQRWRSGRVMYSTPPWVVVTKVWRVLNQICWPWEASRNQWTHFDIWLWNGIMEELFDIPGMSSILRICRSGTCNPKRVEGGFWGLFCVPTDGVLKIPFCDFFIWEVTHSGKNYPLINFLSCKTSNYKNISCVTQWSLDTYIGLSTFF